MSIQVKIKINKYIYSDVFFPISINFNSEVVTSSWITRRNKIDLFFSFFFFFRKNNLHDKGNTRKIIRDYYYSLWGFLPGKND